MTLSYSIRSKRNFFKLYPERLTTEHRCKNDGFTLIEILVAMMILSIALVIVLQLFSGGLKSSQRSNAYTLAVLHAREKMEETLLADRLVDGVYEGKFDDGYTWKAEIAKVQSEKEEENLKIPFITFNILIQVSWIEGTHIKHFEISTLKNLQKVETAT